MNMLAIAYLLDLFGDWKYALEKIVFAIPNLIFLTLDGIVYSVLGYAYKLFELMSRLNLSTFKTWFDPIIENISALIIVVAIFAVGYALINYLINPDKVSDQKIGGMALIKNIAIAAVLLIIYNEFFKTMDDVTFLLIGAPEGTSYSSEIFEAFGIENDGSPGLISNVVYGSNSSSSDEETVDFGVSLAVNTLNIFLHSKGTGTVVDQAYREAIEGKNFGLMKITAAFMNIESFLNDSSTGEVQYRFPILSTVVGLFIVYMLVTISIELGIRALKLIILELLAPIAIITIIKDGMEAKMWKNWWSVFWKTYADIFIRVASMYIVVGIISRAWKNIADLFVNSATSGDFTQYLLLVMIIVAGFKLAKELPGFIDSILGSKLADNNKNGFKNFLGGLAGGLVGGIGGVATGIATSKANGLSAAAGAWNAIKGGVGGAVAGSKGQKISDHINNINKHKEGLRTSAETMATRGGTLRSNMAYQFREKTGLNYAGQKRTEKAIKAENDSYSQQQWVHDQNVQKLSEAHERAVQGHQDNINKYQESIRTKTEAMKKADSSIIDSRTGSAIKFDENYMQNAVDGDSAVRTSRNVLTMQQQKYKEAVESGKNVIGAHRDLIDAENAVATAEAHAIDEARKAKTAYEASVGLDADKKALQASQNALNKENSDYTTYMRTENNKFKAVTESHEDKIKGTVDRTTGKRSGGLEKELKKYGGKSS